MGMARLSSFRWEDVTDQSFQATQETLAWKKKVWFLLSLLPTGRSFHWFPCDSAWPLPVSTGLPLCFRRKTPRCLHRYWFYSSGSLIKSERLIFWNTHTHGALLWQSGFTTRHEVIKSEFFVCLHRNHLYLFYHLQGLNKEAGAHSRRFPYHHHHHLHHQAVRRALHIHYDLQHIQSSIMP